MSRFLPAFFHEDGSPIRRLVRFLTMQKLTIATMPQSANPTLWRVVDRSSGSRSMVIAKGRVP